MHFKLNSVRRIVLGVVLGFGFVATSSAQHAEDELGKEATLVGAAEPETESERYGDGVRSTPWQDPATELAGMHLMPGFEIRLFAAEPDIAKPLNLAFDDRGRMWVTQSVEYPYPAAEGEPARDAVMILEDTNGDGSADKFTKFADGLNIPIGVLPYGEGCLCFSIPNLWYLRDTNGDGVCDKREVVLGPFDTSRDTHGMVNALRDGGDGWIYACHGFNNQSVVAGTDGHEVVMHSGNTFRFRPDGSRVEHVTHGQVNPFGMAEDEWGYRYSADCHSKPITQLIRGACYPSFGKPHDGLGFLPPMMDHLHGSTAICGLVAFTSTSPWATLRGQMLSGNVMTSRINRNRVRYRGATAIGEELPDFLTCDDPWFRPVDLRFGPDGNLYVADFYNKIIGHYEVPLDHPERDRTSGRIWQIRRADSSGAKMTADSLAECRRVAIDPTKPTDERRFALKRIGRSGPFELDLMVQLLQDRSDPIRVAAIGLVSEWLDRHPEDSRGRQVRERALELLDDPNAHVVRSAAELTGLHGNGSEISTLLDRLRLVTNDDPVLTQTFRIAIRNLLPRAKPDSASWDSIARSEHADILLGLKGAESADALLLTLREHPNSVKRDSMLSHIAKNASLESIEACVSLVRESTKGDRSKQFELLGILVDAQSGRSQAGPLRAWALELVTAELGRVDAGEHLVSWSSSDGKRWANESREFRGGASGSLVSSLTLGEKYLGRWVSDDFPAPASIGFRLAGHNGFPKEPDHEKNRVRLVRSRDGKVLKRVTPPRNDVADWVEWQTEDLGGERVRIECVDGDSGRAYAWIAIGAFSPAWIGQSASAESLSTALQWIKRMKLTEMAEDLESLVMPSISMRLRLEIVHALAQLRGQPEHAILAEQIQGIEVSPDVTEDLIQCILKNDVNRFDSVLETICRSLSSSQQVSFAGKWTKESGSIDRLLEMIAAGWLSPYVLMAAEVGQVLDARLDDRQRERVQELTGNLEPEVAGQSQLARIADALKGHRPDAAAGELLFTQHCSNCHQLRGKGKVVGPQLDGAVARSIERLLEDIVTPDRNVDRAFRTTSLLLEDGRVLVGLLTVDTDKEIRMVEPDGKTRVVDPATVEQRKEAGRSLMPGNLWETLSPQQLGDLIGFVRGT